MCQADNKSSFSIPEKVHLLAVYSATLLQYLETLRTDRNFHRGKQHVTFSMLAAVHHKQFGGSFRQTT